MEIKNYEELVSLVSRQVADKFLREEKNISGRALLVDGDIAEITQRIGLEATKIIYEEVMKEHVGKKKRRGWR